MQSLEEKQTIIAACQRWDPLTFHYKQNGKDYAVAFVKAFSMGDKVPRSKGKVRPEAGFTAKSVPDGKFGTFNIGQIENLQACLFLNSKQKSPSGS